MPETKLGLAAIREHLRQYLWLYIIGIALAMVFTNLLWTVTEPRVPNDRAVVICLAGDMSDSAALSDIAGRMLERLQAEGARVDSVEFQDVSFPSSLADYTGPLILRARLDSGEPDAFLASAPAMAALTESGDLMPPETLTVDGRAPAFGLEPCYAELPDDLTGRTVRVQTGWRLDPVDALMTLGAFDNRGAFLAVTSVGGNPETTARALEIMMEELAGRATRE